MREIIKKIPKQKITKKKTWVTQRLKQRTKNKKFSDVKKANKLWIRP